MKKFYICTTGIAKGPYDISDVDKLDINSNDLIWANRLFDCRPAFQVPELNEYFKKKHPGGKLLNARVPGYQKAVLALLLSAVAGMMLYYFTMAQYKATLMLLMITIW